MIRWHDRFGGRHRRTWTAAWVVLMTVVATPPLALGQDADLRPLLDRMNRLERDIRTLNLQVFRGEAPTTPPSSALGDATAAGGPAIARMDVRITSLEEELRSLTGRVEEFTYTLDQINKRLDKLVGDVDYRLSALEQGRAPAAGTPTPPSQPLTQSEVGGADRSPQYAPPPSTTTSYPPPSGRPQTLGSVPEQDVTRLREQGPATRPAGIANAPSKPSAAAPAETVVAALPDGTPKEQYDYARGLLLKGQYDEAETALKAFLDQNGSDPLAGNARYWLGETYYVRSNYVQAAEVFLEGYQADPKGDKAPDTLLKLGMSLTNLDKKKEACAAFGKLQADYPKALARIKRLVDTERQRAGCN